jgi:hypothetical protein
VPREVELTRDPATGRITSVHVRGIKGPACEEIERFVAEHYAEPSRSERTAEYHQTGRVEPRVRGTGGGR